jgi:hypothetical protein
MCHSSKVASGVQLPGEAPCAASIKVMQQTLNLWNGVRYPGGAPRAGVTGTGIPNRLKPDCMCVRIAPSALNAHWGNRQTRSALDREFSWFEARVSSFAAAHGLRLRLRTADDPARHRGAAPRPRSPMAGGTILRRWAVRVRIPSRTRVTMPLGPTTGRSL